MFPASMCVEAGQVHLPREAPWVDEVQRQVLGTPVERHDDRVDSMSQYLNWISIASEPRIRSRD